MLLKAFGACRIESLAQSLPVSGMDIFFFQCGIRLLSFHSPVLPVLQIPPDLVIIKSEKIAAAIRRRKVLFYEILYHQC